MKCPKCQFENRDGASFCLECGKELEVKCTFCKKVLPLSAKFCDNCGQKAYKAEKLEKKVPEINGERKYATVLFSDLNGYTAMTERLDPEEVKEIMSRIFGEIAQVVAKYEGFIEKFVGDAVLAFFGVPKTHEDDPVRAIRAAREIHDLVEAISPQLEKKVGRPLSMHSGINTGLVVIGDIDIEKGTHGIIGDTINLASRIEGLAKAGEILVSHETYRHAERLFSFEALKPLSIKGKSEPVQVYRLIGLKPRQECMHVLDTRKISSAIIGRERELTLVKDSVDKLLNGEGGIIFVEGEAGIGKSRLIAEIRQQTSSVLWLEGRALSYGHSISYLPFQGIFWQYAGITEDDNEVEVWRKLENRITSLFAESTAEVLPYLASLLTLQVTEEYAGRVKYVDGEAMGHQIFLVSRWFFESLSQTRPLVLVFEDFHWVDESSCLLLEHLLPLVKRAPILICGVSRLFRTTQAERLRRIASENYTSRYTEVHLKPLSRTNSEQLIHNLLVSGNLSPRLYQMIIHNAEGNPFFLEEIIRSLIDMGVVVCDETTGRWQATKPVETITIPDTIKGVIMARADRLDEDIKQVLKMASVIGRSFFYRVLHSITEAYKEIDPHLVKLQDAEFIREKQRFPELEYIFKHALTQEAMYESILLHKRRELHARVGKAIEDLFTDRLDEFYSLLAYHYAQAEAWEKAQEYLLKAGDKAGQIAADAEALEHYRQVLTAYEKVFGEEWEPLQRATLERKMGEAFFRKGDHAEAIDSLQQALSYLGKSLPKSFLGSRAAIILEIIKQIGHRIFPWLFVDLKGGPVEPKVEEELRLYEFIGWIDAFGNNERFLLIAARGLNYSERTGYSYGISTGSMALGTINNLLEIHWLAESYHLRAVEIAESIQHPGAVRLAYNGLSIHNMCLGNWGKAIEYGMKAAGVYQETGDLHGYGYVIYMATLAMVHQGNFAQALENSLKIVRSGQEGADPQVRCWGLACQGAVHRRLGQLNEAIDVLQEACELSVGTQDCRFRLFAGAELGRSYLRKGQFEQALTVLEDSHQFYIENRCISPTWLPFFNGLTEAYLLATEERDKSKRSGWMKKAKRSCQDALKHGKGFRGVMPEAMRFKGTYEWLKGNSSSAMKWWQRSIDLAEKMGQRYDLGMTYLEIGRRAEDNTLLQRAVDILTGLGAEWDLMMAKEAIKTAKTN